MAKPTAESIVANVLKEYGWSDAETMRKSPEWGRALQESSGNPTEALKVLSSRRSVVDVPGFFVSQAKKKEWSDEANDGRGGYVVVQTGTTILLANGRVVTVWGQDLPGAKPIATRVVVQGLSAEKNIAEGYESFKQGSSTKVLLQPHSEAIPQVGLNGALRRCSFRNKRGCWQGSQNAVATLTIGTGPEDVSYFPANEERGYSESLNVMATDPSGNTVRVKLPIPVVRETFGIKGSRSRDFAEALAGEAILVHGQVSLLRTIEADRVQDAQTELTGLYQSGLLKSFRKTDDGTELHALNLRKATIQLEDGTETQQTHVTIGDLDVYDIVEKKPGQFELSIPTRTTSDGTIIPQFNPVEGKNGFNSGAFVVFVNKLLGRPKESDPFFQAAKAAGLVA